MVKDLALCHLSTIPISHRKWASGAFKWGQFRAKHKSLLCFRESMSAKNGLEGSESGSFCSQETRNGTKLFSRE